MSDEELSRKRKIRGAHRASVTRLLGQVDGLVRATTPNIDELTLFQTNLGTKLALLEALNSEIVNITPEDQLEEEVGRADEYTEKIQRALLVIGKCIRSTSKTPSLVPSSRSATPPTPVSGTPPPLLASSSDSGGKVKLPKISLPHFKGNPIYWTAFWDSYESAIHLNSSLTDVDKFNYLRSLLEKTAYEAIAGLSLSSVNYHEAIEILRKRFGNPQIIISRHMEILLNLPAVSGDHDLKGLRHLYNEVETNVRSLRALGVDQDSYGTMLTSVLLTKLPPEMRLILSRRATGEVLSLETLQTVFEEELMARERSHTGQSKPVRHGYNQDTSFRLPPTATTLLSGSRLTGASSCSYCQQSHSEADCSNVTTIDSRIQILKTAGRCFNCLTKGHVARKCRSPPQCQTCRRKHHTSICDQSRSTGNTKTQLTRRTEQTSVTVSTLNPEAVPFSTKASTGGEVSAGFVLLQTAKAIFYNPQNPERQVELRILLDSGSQRSYMTERARNLLSLKAESKQSLSIAAFGSSRGCPKTCKLVRAGVLLEGFPNLSLSLFVVPMICEPLIGQPIYECVEQNPHLIGLRLSDDLHHSSPVEVDVLIGFDHYWDIVTGTVRKGNGGPTAIHSKLGWVLSGPTMVAEYTQSSINLVTTHVLRADVDVLTDSTIEQLKAFWDLESMGVDKVEEAKEEYPVEIEFVGGRYQVSLPWKQLSQSLPDNYLLSKRRLVGLLNRLRRNPELLQEYDRVIQEQIKQGIVEDVPTSVMDSSSTCVHYLPHHGIVRRDKNTTRLRVVYDASAKLNSNPSLNDCLMVGPKFNQKVLNILMRFRSHRIAITADIEKAFLMIAVAEEDRDALRFLWVKDINEEDIKLRPLRFTRVVFGVCSSPFLLNSTIRYHLERHRESHPHLVQKLIESFYVDDVVSGASNEEEAFKLYTDSKQIFKKAAFNLRKFKTNSQLLQQRIDIAENLESRRSADDIIVPEQEKPNTTDNISAENTSLALKVLGVTWDPEDDRLYFTVSQVAEAAAAIEPKKRNVVRIIGKFYDPMGLLAPVIVPFKRLFQKLCENQIQWDVTLPDAFREEWESLVRSLHSGGSLSIPRSYFSEIDDGDISSYTLHGFCDASMSAYAAVVYLTLETRTRVFTRFVVAKTRVTPLQPVTIPRLELLGAVLLSRLIDTGVNALRSTLPLGRVKCYTDSTATLYWIKGVNKQWKPFVQNRVNDIRRKVPPGVWEYCPGVTNPADLPSRGMTIGELQRNGLWRFGPDWLGRGVGTGHDELVTEMPQGCIDELQVGKKTHNLIVQSPLVSEIMSCDKFGSLRKLVRVTAYVIRAVRLFKRELQSHGGPLSVDEQATAECYWVKVSQKVLEQDRLFDSLKRQLNLFLDENGMWRCRGRLGNADLPYSMKYPLLLARNHSLTPLVIADAHERVFHNGLRETLTEIRRKFWIVKGRSLVRAIIYKCVLCRRIEGMHFPTPPPPPLPKCRVSEQPPFTFTGVDYAGPLFIRSEELNKPSKAWICLYTCLVTRAIHLDIVCDMSTETFIRCLKRFAARRGLPLQFVSDNGKTFKGTARFLKSVFRDDAVHDHLSGRGCKWTFNIERAPWWGGAFERMVKSTKRCLRKVMGRASLTHDELLTIVTEVESIINSRPLSYMASGDLGEPLTPSHLLTGRRVLSLPDYLDHSCELGDEDFDVSSSLLTKRMKHLSNILNHFWKRWRSEYLPELRESHRQLLKKSKDELSCSVSVGDMVIVHEESLPRSLWKMGCVEALITGQDGKTRGAKVRTIGKNGRVTFLNRPLKLLYPLEVPQDTDPAIEVPCTTIHSTNEAVERPSDNSTEDVPVDLGTPTFRSRPRRTAARRGEEIRRMCMSELY